MPSCLGHLCNCTGPHDSTPPPKGGNYSTCACGHAEQTHKGPERGATSTTGKTTNSGTGKPILTPSASTATKKSIKFTKKKTPSQNLRQTLTPKEARAKLVAAGIPVGQRGRLTADQMAQAARL